MFESFKIKIAKISKNLNKIVFQKLYFLTKNIKIKILRKNYFFNKI